MTGGKTAVLAAVAILAVPAAADARRGSIYTVTKATGFERLTFSGDADSNCVQFAVCGYHGTVTYKIGGKPEGIIALTKSRSGRVNANAKYQANGKTTASVTPPAGGPECTDSATHKSDHFGLISSGPKLQSLLLSYHEGSGDDYLETACTGPTEADAENADALPEGLFRAKDFFRGRRPKLGLSGATPFKQAGFNATIEWNLHFKARERDCSPRCKLPGGGL